AAVSTPLAAAGSVTPAVRRPPIAAVTTTAAGMVEPMVVRTPPAGALGRSTIARSDRAPALASTVASGDLAGTRPANPLGASTSGLTRPYTEGPDELAGATPLASKAPTVITSGSPAKPN